RAAVILGPGVYDFGSTGLTLDAQYIDLIGLSREGCRLTCSGSTIIQTADDVLIQDVTIVITKVTGPASPWSDATVAAYFPDSDLSDAKLRRVTLVPSFGGLATRGSI